MPFNQLHATCTRVRARETPARGAFTTHKEIDVNTDSSCCLSLKCKIMKI